LEILCEFRLEGWIPGVCLHPRHPQPRPILRVHYAITAEIERRLDTLPLYR
jgi:hypothetical protein